MLAVLIMILVMFPLYITSETVVKVTFCEEIVTILETIKTIIPTNEVGELLKNMML